MSPTRQPDVLDASALLAFIRAERGHETVAAAIEAGAQVCSVNTGEVMTVLVRDGVPIDGAANLIGDLPVDVVHLDLDLALRVGAMILHTRPHGLSFGDRACLALGARQGATVLTADRGWLKVASSIGVTVRLIR